MLIFLTFLFRDSILTIIILINLIRNKLLEVEAINLNFSRIFEKEVPELHTEILVVRIIN